MLNILDPKINLFRVVELWIEAKDLRNTSGVLAIDFDRVKSAWVPARLFAPELRQTGELLGQRPFGRHKFKRVGFRSHSKHSLLIICFWSFGLGVGNCHKSYRQDGC